MTASGRKTYIKNVILPGFLLSGLTGVLTGALIFFFRWGAEAVTAAGQYLYAAVRTQPAFIPVLVAALVGFGFVAAFVIKFSPAAGGGGIPTAEGVLRGLITFRWLRTLIGMIFGSYISFFVGLPLGSEGPSVLMGAAIGKGADSVLCRPRAWDRYVMTGGASAGFAVATGAPVTGVIFALEEAHKRFSPMILTVALSSVVFASLTAELLALAFSREVALFRVFTLASLPIRHFWIAAVAGLAAGLIAALFIKGFTLTLAFFDRVFRLPRAAKLIILFVVVGGLGLLVPSVLGSGHALIESAAAGEIALGLVAIILVAKFITITAAGGAGATGGLFIPVLSLGALGGATLAKILDFGGFSEWHSLVVLLTVAAFLAATLSAPITALAFFIEAFGGSGNNILAAALAVLCAYLVIELFGIKSLYDAVLERKLRAAHEGETPHIIEMSATVERSAFVVGKATRDVFWPPSCVVMQVVREGQPKNSARMDKDGEKVLREGDVLKLRVQTYDETETRSLIADLVSAPTKKTIDPAPEPPPSA